MLQEIADALEAPKRFLWSNVPGLHDDSGNPLTGAQVAHNAFGTDTDSVWGKALGLGLDVAGDPLNVIAPMATRGLGAAARGLGLLGDAAGVGGAAADSAYSAMKPLRNSFGMMTGIQDVAPEISDATASLMNAGAMGPRSIMTPGRKLMGNLSGRIDPEAALAAMADAEPALTNPEIGGRFVPFRQGASDATGFGFSTGPLSRRHEVTHGLINAAAQSGETAGLPLSMRVPANLYQSDNPLLKGIAQVLDEAAAHSTASRNPIGQAGHYLDFLLNPHAGYYGQIAQQSPLAARLHASLPYATAAGLSGAGYGVGNQLFGGP